MFATRLKYTTHLEQKQIVNFSSFYCFILTCIWLAEIQKSVKEMIHSVLTIF